MSFTKKPCLNCSAMTHYTYCDVCLKDKATAEDQKVERDRRPWLASGFGSDVYDSSDLYDVEPTTDLTLKSKVGLELKSTSCSGFPYFNTGGVKGILATLKALNDAGTSLPPVEDGRIREASIQTMSTLSVDSEPSDF